MSKNPFFSFLDPCSSPTQPLLSHLHHLPAPNTYPHSPLTLCSKHFDQGSLKEMGFTIRMFFWSKMSFFVVFLTNSNPSADKTITTPLLL